MSPWWDLKGLDMAWGRSCSGLLLAQVAQAETVVETWSQLRDFFLESDLFRSAWWTKLSVPQDKDQMVEGVVVKEYSTWFSKILVAKWLWNRVKKYNQTRPSQILGIKSTTGFLWFELYDVGVCMKGEFIDVELTITNIIILFCKGEMFQD